MQEVSEESGSGNVALKIYNKLISAKGPGIIVRANSFKCMVKRRINKFPGL